MLAIDIGADRTHVFQMGLLLPAVQASTAIPGVFPTVQIEGSGHLDGGIVDNLPVMHAVEGGSREVLGINLMAGTELERPPTTWIELIGRTLQLSMHQRMLSDFDRVRRRARVTVLCPILSQGDGMDLNPKRVENLIERARRATVALLRDKASAPVPSGVRRALHAGGGSGNPLL